MNDKCFIDSNILIYAVCDGSEKCNLARAFLIKNANKIIISSQVINEFVAVLLRKNVLSIENIFEYVDGFMQNFDFAVIRKQDIRTAIMIKQRYKYSYWDSLIIASALEANCSILYTEDMHNGQIIEKRLKILNPFIND